MAAQPAQPAQPGQAVFATMDEPFGRWRLIYVNLQYKNLYYKCLAGRYLQSSNTVIRNDYRTIFLRPTEVPNYHPGVFRSFQVIIPSLFFLGVFRDQNGTIIRENKYPTQIRDSMKTFFRKQIGSHIFIDTQGKVCLLSSFIDANNFYECGSVADINAIYPIIRYVREFDINTNLWTLIQETVFGLYFGRPQIYNEGYRWYHRFHIQRLSAGGVYELSVPFILDLPNYLQTNQQIRYYGIFVCAGAKLVAVDEFQHEDLMHVDQREHNRSFIQQGGMMLVENLFFCKEMKSQFVGNIHYVYIESDWDHFVRHLRTVDGQMLDQGTIDVLLNYENPIIFIGPNDCNYNSIAWEFNSQVKGVLPHLTTKSGPIIPEGARIVAIADGGAGLQEINDRMGYEMLHDSVLTSHRTNFRVPSTVESLERILNVNENRSFSYWLEYIDPPAHKYPSQGLNNQFSFLMKPLFREFNFVKLEAPDLQNYYKRNTRLPVPPMYPPFCSTQHKFQFIPNKDMEREVESCYPAHNLDPYQQTYKLQRNGIDIDCVLLKGHRFIDYDWKREKNPLKQDIALIDYTKQRIGVDGWVWNKVNRNLTSIFTTSLYCPVNDATNLASGVHRVGEIGTPHVTAHGTAHGTAPGIGGVV